MWSELKPSLFYGAAVSACMGLALGVALHGPWQSREGGPQILFASAAAAELARPLNDNDILETSAPADEAAYADNAYLDRDQLPADPLPVIRLTRRGGAAMPAQAEIERVSTDAIATDDGVAQAAVQDDPAQTSPHALLTASNGSENGGL